MNEQLLTLFRFNRKYLEAQLADVADEQFAHQPAPGMNTPAWIVGHLACVHDSGRSLLGEERRLEAEWTQPFRAGSDPAPEGGFPPKQELLERFALTSDGLDKVAQTVDLSELNDPNPFEPLRPTLPTKRDLIAHMLSTHFSVHLGQLSAWRRLIGQGPLF